MTQHQGVWQQESKEPTKTGPNANEEMEVENESDQKVAGPPEEHQAGVYIFLIVAQFLPRFLVSVFLFSLFSLDFCALTPHLKCKTHQMWPTLY